MYNYIYSPIWSIIENLNKKTIYLKFIENRYSLFSPISGILTKLETTDKIILSFICEGKKLKIILYGKNIELFYEIPTIVLSGQHLGSIVGEYCEIEFEDRFHFLVEKYQNLVGGVSQYPIAIFY
jgi:hypothetical protein